MSDMVIIVGIISLGAVASWVAYLLKREKL